MPAGANISGDARTVYVFVLTSSLCSNLMTPHHLLAEVRWRQSGPVRTVQALVQDSSSAEFTSTISNGPSGGQIMLIAIMLALWRMYR